MSDDPISISRQISREIDEPKIVAEVDRLMQIEAKLSQTPRPDGAARSVEEVSLQALSIYRAMSAYDFCGGLEGALEQHARAMSEFGGA